MTHPKLKGVEPQGITGKPPVILLRLVLIFFHQRWQDENLGRFVPSYHCFLWQTRALSTDHRKEKDLRKVQGQSL